MHTSENLDLSAIAELKRTIAAEVGKIIVGNQAAIEALIIALFAQGTAKTLMVRALAAAVGLSFGRIQFTPDLMPSDVLGTHVFDLQAGTFRLTKGPIFTEVLLADEINRAPAKTQSALLEAMQERQISIDGERHPLSDSFVVFATQNPVEHEGTYPLPEAQLDRFLLKVQVGYPSVEEEDEILARAGRQSGAPSLSQLSPVLSRAQLLAARAQSESVELSAPVRASKARTSPLAGFARLLSAIDDPTTTRSPMTAGGEVC